MTRELTVSSKLLITFISLLRSRESSSALLYPSLLCTITDSLFKSSFMRGLFLAARSLPGLWLRGDLAFFASSMPTRRGLVWRVWCFRLGALRKSFCSGAAGDLGDAFLLWNFLPLFFIFSKPLDCIFYCCFSLRVRYLLAGVALVCSGSAGVAFLAPEAVFSMAILIFVIFSICGELSFSGSPAPPARLFSASWVSLLEARNWRYPCLSYALGRRGSNSISLAPSRLGFRRTNSLAPSLENVTPIEPGSGWSLLLTKYLVPAESGGTPCFLDLL